MRAGARRAGLLPARIALTLLVCTAMIEIAVRLLGLGPRVQEEQAWYTSDPVLPFRLRRSLQSAYRTSEFEHEIATNSVGFRDVEHTRDKPEGVFRILGLGDSFTFGAGASREEGYLAQLEKMLNERPGSHPRVEIVNTGCPRYWQEPERMMLEREGLSFAPDLVLVGFVPNDLYDSIVGVGGVQVAPQGYLKTRAAADLGDTGEWLFRRSGAANVVLRRWLARETARRYPVRPLELFVDDGYHEMDWRKIEEEFRQMRDISQARGGRLVLVNIPQRPPWGHFDEYPSRRLGKWAKAHDVPFADALPAMQATPRPERLYWPEDGHCRAEGYHFIARVVFEELTKRALVP